MAALSVCDALRALQATGARLGLLSDAPPDVAEVWPTSDLASLVESDYTKRDM